MTGAQVREQLDRVEEMRKALQRYGAAWDGRSESVEAAYRVAIVEIERLAAKLRGVRLENPLING